MNQLKQAINLLRRAELSRCFLMNRQGGGCDDCLSNDIKKFVESADTDIVSMSAVKNALPKAVPTNTRTRILNDIRRAER